MGTLFEQRPRSPFEVTPSTLESFLKDATVLAAKYGISVADVIAAKKVLEIERRNNLYMANGDTFDEQMAGLGSILNVVAQAAEQRNELHRESRDTFVRLFDEKITNIWASLDDLATAADTATEKMADNSART